LFVVGYLQVRNNQSRLEKCQKCEKIQLRSDDAIKKILAKCTNFEVSSVGLKFKVLVSRFLIKSLSQSFYKVLVLKVTVSTALLENVIQLCTLIFEVF